MSTTNMSNSLVDTKEMLDQNRPDPAVENKRKYKRFSISGDARIMPSDDNSTEETTLILLRDISRGGIGFFCDRILDPGVLYRIQLQVSDRSIGSQPAMICYCLQVQENLYSIGAEWVVEP